MRLREIFVRPLGRFMEAIINMVWLFVAVGAFSFFALRRSRPKAACQSRRQTLGGLVALACALIILFPIISPTDDLQAQEPMLEECSRPLLKLGKAAQGPPNTGKHVPQLATVPQDHSFGNSIQTLGKVVLQQAQIPPLTLARASAGRAPPFTTSTRLAA